MAWAGGVGPFDVRYEWDDNTSFTSPLTVLNTSVTSPNSAVPSSDLGPIGTDWYLRVTVIDNNDAGELQEPVGGSLKLLFPDAKSSARYLYLDHNIGVGFTTNLGDGNPNTFPRYLYLDHNITSDQPCPWLDFITPTLQSQGETVTLFGTGFGALQTTYTTEIRLHDDNDLTSPFVLMTATSWSETEISVTVPSGGSTGWVAVVHTNGGATCPGSTLHLLQILTVLADPESGWFIKAVDKQNADIQGISVIPFNVTEASFQKIMNSIGSGVISIPINDETTVESIIDPLTRIGTFIRIYIHSKYRYGFFAQVLGQGIDDDGQGVVMISGQGLEVIAEWSKIQPQDHPVSPSLSPIWQYGTGRNALLNAGFDDSAEDPVITNPGGEDGNDDDGNVEGWGTRGSNVTSYIAVEDLNGARTGEWYIEVTSTDNHSGIEQSIPVTPNRVYHIQVYVNDPTAAGLRVTLAVGGADNITATTTYPNNFTFNNEILAELDNVARNGAGNGCPGGLTDGTWQVMDVEVLTGSSQTSLTIAIQDDHHGVCVPELHVPFRIDDVTIEGWGLGLDPWVAFDFDNHASNSFRLVTTPTLNSSPRAVSINPLALFAGIEQIVKVNPGTKYTAIIWARQSSPAVDDFCRLVMRKNNGAQTLIATTLNQVPGDNVFESYTVAFTTDSTTEELIFRFAYTGPNNPGPIIIDSASLIPGNSSATAGVIATDVLDKMALVGKLTYLARTWTATHDSRGRLWPSSLFLDIDPSESLFDLLSRFVALGHEWEIVPTNFAEGNDTGVELNIFTARPLDPLSGIGTSWISDSDGPVITPGDAVVSGQLLKKVFNINSVMALGDDGVWSQVQQFPYETIDIPPGDPATLGYKDSFGIIEDVITVSSSDATTVSQFAKSRIADEKGKERALQVEMADTSLTVRPFLHFGVGDSLFVDMPPGNSDIPDPTTGLRSNPKRIRAIQASLSGEGADVLFTIDIDRVIFRQELIWLNLIAQLAEHIPSDNTGVGTGSVVSAGSTGSVSGGVVVVGSSTASSPSVHRHSLSSTEITSKTLSGDVSGTLPGPVTVNRLKGNPISGTIPATIGAGAIVMVFDENLNTWVPVELDASFASRFLLGGM